MMTRVPVPVLEGPRRPAADPVPGRLRRQRRTAVGISAVLSAALVPAAITGSVIAWLLVAALAVLGTAYAMTALRLRRLATEREMSLAFLRDPDFDWAGLEAGLGAERLVAEPAAEEPTVVDHAERGLARFVGAYLLGWVLTPVIVVLRRTGGPVDLRAHPVLARIVEAQESGRAQSLRLLAAGVVATAGVGAVGSLASATVASASPAPAPHSYTVRSGDTLGAIAARFGTTTEALASANGIGDPNLILPGEVLRLPGAIATAGVTRASAATPEVPGTYTVRPGDTLATIASRFATTVGELAVRNRITDPNRIYVGEVLRLRGAPVPAETAPAEHSAPAATEHSDPTAAASTEEAHSVTATSQAPATDRATTPAATTGQTGSAPSGSPAPQAAPAAGESAAAATAVRVALEQVGVPYVWGGATPQEGFDCSGLVMYAYAAAGVHLDHYTVSQYQETTRVSASQLLPGDLVFYDNYNGPQPGHVAMYIGNGMVVSANEPGTNVQTQSINYDGTIIGYGRVG